jgi:hypothetical protein
MYVIKRDGREEKVHLDKITARISKLTEGLDMRFIDPVSPALPSHADSRARASHALPAARTRRVGDVKTFQTRSRRVRRRSTPR